VSGDWWIWVRELGEVGGVEVIEGLGRDQLESGWKS